MYEDKTYEALLREKLAQVPSTLDKREGSIIFDAMAPNSVESAMLYRALDTVLNESFADTASRPYLIKRCAERGITPKPATAGRGIGVFNMDVPQGTRFSIDKYNWVVTEKIEDGRFYMMCETAGSAPCALLGRLFPIAYIDGLTEAELVSIAIYGEDEESTEDLRKRYLKSFNNQMYGFNRAQYVALTKELPGVGGCKPVRAGNGPGTVKLVITGADYGAPGEELIPAVQEAMDPGENGEGMGIAPIDHTVTVAGAVGVKIHIKTKLTFAENWDLDRCKTYIEEALDAYYNALNTVWDESEKLIVRVSEIESKLLALEGIIDVSDTQLNRQNGNVTLGEYEVVERGDFALAEF